MDSTQTLHDFVLNLLTNPEARSAFELDPEGTLNEAGLGDITAADVRDVVPLVVDYAPVQGIAGLAPTGDLGLGGLSAIDSDPANVIGQLQSVTNQLTLGAQSTNADVNVAAVGAIAVDSTGLGVVTTSVVPGVGVVANTSGVAADLSGMHDVADTLDSDVVGPVGADATGAVDTTVGTADSLLGGASAGGVLGTADFTVNSVTSDLVDSLDVPAVGSGSLVGDSSLVGGATGTVDSTLDGVGVGGLLGGDAGVDGSAEAEVHGSTDGGLLGATDILF